MSDYPINYTFVTKKTLSITEDNGSTNEHVILVLDDKANTAYFKKIESFQKTLENCPGTPTYWTMTQAFGDLAVTDLMREEFIETVHNTGEHPTAPTLLGIKVLVTNDTDEPLCHLYYGDSADTRIENTYWK